MCVPELDDKKRGGAFRKRISHTARSNPCDPFVSHLATGNACVPFLDPNFILCRTSRAARSSDCQASGKIAQCCGRGKKEKKEKNPDLPAFSDKRERHTRRTPALVFLVSCATLPALLPTSRQVKQSQANKGEVSECPTIWPK